MEKNNTCLENDVKSKLFPAQLVIAFPSNLPLFEKENEPSGPKTLYLDPPL